MQQKISMLSMLFLSLLLSSCGTNKKLQAAMAEGDQLKYKNIQLNNVNSDLQKQITDLTAGNKSLTEEFARYKTDCQSTESKLELVQAKLKEQYDALQQMKKKIQDALNNFQDKGVEVYYKDGLVYVSMQDNLLYKSGSAALGDSGKSALSALASVLNEYPKLKVIVLGNTDDQQFKNGGDNWSLSTERANGVVRIFRDELSVDPTRLTSAGKGKYNPVADNTTPEGRAKNRRTDIILNPDLEKLWESVQ